MPYYIDHPQHGSHVCYSPEDVEVHKKLGWVPRETKNPVVDPEKKKPGRPKKVKYGD